MRQRDGRSAEVTNVPTLSVIVTVVEGDAALSGCLDAISKQIGAPEMEVIVPYDDTVRDVACLAERFPTFQFVNLGAISDGVPRNAFAQHALYERRRAAGLARARARLIGLLEDRGWPRADWARTMTELHNGTEFGAIGGGIENGAAGSLRWALFFCDYGRYQPPLVEGDSEYLTDINVCYKREALESVRKLWQHSYKEATVNWALRRHGYRLMLSPRPIVVERRQVVSLFTAALERMHWARGFGHVRGREAASPLRCLLWAATVPGLPTLLFVRHCRRQVEKRRNIREFVRAIPAIITLLHFWSLGELIGYCEAAAGFWKSEQRPAL